MWSAKRMNLRTFQNQMLTCFRMVIVESENINNSFISEQSFQKTWPPIETYTVLLIRKPKMFTFNYILG